MLDDLHSLDNPECQCEECDQQGQFRGAASTVYETSKLLYTYSQTDNVIVYVLRSETCAHMITQSFFFLVTAFAPPAPPDTPR